MGWSTGRSRAGGNAKPRLAKKMMTLRRSQRPAGDACWKEKSRRGRWALSGEALGGVQLPLSHPPHHLLILGKLLKS